MQSHRKRYPEAIRRPEEELHHIQKVSGDIKSWELVIVLQSITRAIDPAQTPTRDACLMTI
jgi:hypothetical protein